MKTEIHPYLTFDGNCEKAFDFYRKVFKSEFAHIGRFGEMPPMEGMPSMPVEMANRIMHVSLPLGGGSVLMGSDGGGDGGCSPEQGLVVGNNITLSLTPESRAEADRLFAALSEGGIVGMPMEEVFWGAYFGTLTDKFGINWMINIENK